MYQVIARKYRPRNFAEVVSQDHVQQTRTNALAQGRVGHGYIFAGQRGTGKTTVARILAKCLNCERGAGPEPCLECASCREIAAGSALDVIEIDAASNRGIDDVRELRENVRYRPARDRYKVFIIDEAHQITDAAFNALLKTLEEPPEWAVFLLCTTEAHKIPATISSRCQNFTFRMVEFDRVVERMQWICGQEGIEAEPDALAVIALAGDGSIRDSLSALDQAIASFGKTLRAAEVRRLLGVVGGEALEEVTAALAEGSASRMLELVERLAAGGQNLQHFAGELARYFRNLLVARTVGASSRLIAATEEERRRLEQYAGRFSEEDLTRYVQLILNLYRDLQHAPHPRFHLELGLVKLVQAGRLVSIEEALAGGGATPAPPRPAPVPAAPVPPSGDLRSRLAAALLAQGQQFTADAVEHSRVEEAGGEVIFYAPADQQFVLESDKAAVEKQCEQLLGRRVKVRVVLPESATAAASPPPRPAEQASSAQTRAMAHPQVQSFVSAFGGQVREVRDLKEK